MYENGFKKEDVSVEWDGFDVMKETDIIVRAGDSLLLAVKVEGATYYPLTDIQGTVWGYVDSQNSIVAQWRYDAWGNAIGGNVSVPALVRLRYRFQGREWSAATGLVNFRMRWYDSETGRWLSKDPIGLSGGLNLYAFCGNNTIIFCDPYGKCGKNSVSDAWWNGAMNGFCDGFGKGLAATIDGMIPFGDPLSNIYTDNQGNLDDDIYSISQGFGVFSSSVLGPVAAARGLAAISKFGAFRVLNQNRYLRIGNGNIPRNRPFTDGPGQNVPTLRIGNGRPSPLNHFDLRLWGR